MTDTDWIRVEDRLPEVDERVRAKTVYGDIETGDYTGIGKAWFDKFVTHWYKTNMGW